MQFVEKGIENEKTLLLLPGTCCNWETNFMRVLPELEKKYHLICVNYDGFDGSDAIFPDIITVTEKIEKYIIENHNGKVDGALGSSLGGTFVGQLAVRKNIHIDRGIFGSSDLDQSGPVSAKLQSMLVTPLLTGVTKNMAKRNKAKKLLKKMARHLLAFYVKCALKLFGRDISGIRPVPVYKRYIGDVDYVVGADLFVKNSPYARFDENFFLYYEETDMQLRMKNDGLRRSLIEGPSVMHLVRGGKNKMDDVLRYGSFSIIQSEISKVRYTKKNLSAVIAFLLKLMISLHWLSPYVLKNTHKFYRKLWGV
jgi:hypothetical protein